MLIFALDGRNRELFLRFYYKLGLKVKKAVMVRPLKGGETDRGSVFDALLMGGGLEPWQVGKVRALRAHFSKLSQLSGFAALRRLVRHMGYGDYLKKQHADLARLDILLALASQTPDIEAFLRRLGELRETVERRESPPNCLFTLSTIHASKGLEYDRVILIDVVDGLFPAVAQPSDREAQAALEEERRLFYVGVTRARQRLELLCWEKKFGEEQDTAFSFVTQLLGESSVLRDRTARTSSPRRGPTALTAAQAAAWERAYVPGVSVIHRKFGRGRLESGAGGIAVIDFQETGVKKVDLSTCLRQGLLRLE